MDVSSFNNLLLAATLCPRACFQVKEAILKHTTCDQFLYAAAKRVLEREWAPPVVSPVPAMGSREEMKLKEGGGGED